MGDVLIISNINAYMNNILQEGYGEIQEAINSFYYLVTKVFNVFSMGTFPYVVCAGKQILHHQTHPHPHPTPTHCLTTQSSPC